MKRFLIQISLLLFAFSGIQVEIKAQDNQKIRANFKETLDKLFELLGDEEKLNANNSNDTIIIEDYEGYISNIKVIGVYLESLKNIPRQITIEDGKEVEFPGLIQWESGIIQQNKINLYDDVIEEYFKDYRVDTERYDDQIGYLIRFPINKIAIATHFVENGWDRYKVILYRQK